jgi:hypothetical protein
MGKVLTLWNEEGINEKDASVLRKKSSDVPASIDKEGLLLFALRVLAEKEK